MSKEELEKEIRKYLKETFHHEYYDDVVMVMGFAEPREKQIAELERKYQELVDKLHHCWNCKKSCPLGKRLEAEKKKCKDWDSTFGIND